ncbi:DUF1007 family protein [Desulfocurvibacter africanus]|uniref:DUF1007 family protein n=1 Tax=Desulfocurvibacter africanus TaxID=873 RepID=UPI000418ED27|nr:DUF1007 family protein [Desulfocurvibacter africanus]
MHLAILALLAVCLAPLPAFGHPHVFTDCELTFVFDAGGLSGIRQRWTFDEMFSTQIVDMVDKDGNGRLSEAEGRAMEQEAFVNLKGFNYFTHASLDGRKVAFATAKDFRPQYAKGILSYEFFLPLAAPAQQTQVGKPRTLIVAVYDQSYYTDMALVEAAPKLLGAERFKTGLKVEEADTVHTSWGPIMPKDVILTFGPR